MLLWRLNGLILSIIILSKAQSNSRNEKSQIVQVIQQKVLNITSNAFTKPSPSFKKNILDKTDSRLKSSAQRYDVKNDKYMQMVMNGLKLLAKKNSQIEPIRKQSESFVTLRPQYKNHLKIKSDTISVASHRPHDVIVKQITEKVLNLIKKYLDMGKTAEKKQLIIQHIRNKVLESAQKQHSLHMTHEEITAYTDLITHGMELMMKELPQSKRRMNIIINEISTPATLNRTTTSMSCAETVIKTCTDVKYLNQYVCPDSGKILSLDKLCDGVIDCSKGSDEENCVEQVITRLQNVIRIMSHVKTYLSKNCFISSDDTLLIKHNFILKNVLEEQLVFLTKYTNKQQNDLPKDTKPVKKTLNEVVIFIKAIDMAFDSSLCTKQLRNTSNIDVIAQNQISLLGDDIMTPKRLQSKMSLKSCSCVESFCVGTSCPETCKNFCWYMFNLGRWGCQAIDETTSVALDLLCDGKLDCYDKTDESRCSTGATINKFEANEIYVSVLNIIKIKSVFKEYKAVQNKLLSLYAAVNELQKETAKPRADATSIKRIRDNCFSQLVTIYEEMINKATAINELHDIQLTLLTINEKLGTALKLSYTGNDKIISRTGCICREFQCLLPQCSKSCEIACSVKPKLTKYWCVGSGNNISIPIEGICNKKSDCPFEDDEAQCLSDVCRKYHLMLLRQSIQDAGEKQKGTFLGEALISWRTKATSILKIAEKNYRPTPTTFRDVINDILNDLVMTYASIEQNIITNKKNEYILKEFLDIAQRVVRSLRSCGQ